MVSVSTLQEAYWELQSLRHHSCRSLCYPYNSDGMMFNSLLRFYPLTAFSYRIYFLWYYNSREAGILAFVKKTVLGKVDFYFNSLSVNKSIFILNSWLTKLFFNFFPFYQQNGSKMFVRYFIKLVEKDVALIRCLLFYYYVFWVMLVIHSVEMISSLISKGILHVNLKTVLYPIHSSIQACICFMGIFCIFDVGRHR